MVTKEKVLKALSEVIDMELGLDIVSLGFIYGVDVDSENNVKVTMTMTTPSCPLAGLIVQDAEDKVSQIEGVKSVKIDLTFDPPWNPGMMSEEVRNKLGI
ncbi:MAG: aromatic ring hydroxylase [Thermotogae bacterium]|nr:metal-sulfur cluster assembly factor [Thermotogaceae bacterium]RKX37731.1 MAG: aromatic ring hydroxylase [Thermotogota bacterium]